MADPTDWTRQTLDVHNLGRVPPQPSAAPAVDPRALLSGQRFRPDPNAPPLPPGESRRPLGKDPVSDFVEFLKGVAFSNEADSSIAQHSGAMVGAALPIVGGVRQGIKAYHGSPHDFDRFDFSKIGTGEGAQAYGHGGYFAGAEPTADFYRAKLSGRPDVLVGGERVAATPSTPSALFGPHEADATVAARIANKMHQQNTIGRPLPLEVALNHIDAEIEQSMFRAAEGRGDPALYGRLRDQRIALQRFRERGIDLTRPGHMYEVNIDAAPQQLLDWDKRIGEHSPEVREAVARAYGRTPEWADWTRGEHVYKALDGGRMAAGISSPEAGQRLAREGVPGIQYLDEGSRGRGLGNVFQSGNGNWFAPASSTPYATREAAQAALDASSGVTRNYTIFDDAKLAILRKYGLLPPLAAAAAPRALDALRQPTSRDQLATPPPPPPPTR